MPTILDSPTRDYPSIRRSLLVNLDEGVAADVDRLLSNAVIEDQMYLPAAEAEMIALYPGAANMSSLTTAQQATVRRATVLLTAARLSPVVPTVKKESFREHSYEVQVESGADRSVRLRGDALNLIGSLVEPSAPTGLRTSRFRRAGVRRCAVGIS